MLIKATGIVGAQNQFYIIYLTKILKGRVKFIYSAPDRQETKKNSRKMF
jgi:predicted transcriptional regulator